MATRISCELRLLGHNLDHHAITAALGVEPTRTWRFGDSIQGTCLRRDRDGWVLASTGGDQLDVAATVSGLVQTLRPMEGRIGKLRREAAVDVVVSCGVYIVDAAPSMYLAGELIEALAALGASLDVDLILTAPRPGPV